MNHRIPRLVVAGTIALGTLAVPAHSQQVINQVKSRVDAIKKETAAIKTKTEALQGEVTELVETVGAQVLDTVQIKEALEPLFGLKDRFGEIGFDPAEFLDLIDTEEIQSLIAQLQQGREEAQNRLNDPNLESFRDELLDVLEGINSLVAEDGRVQATPFQTLVERAPRPLLGILKASMDPVFEPLKEDVLSAAARIQELRAAGMFELHETLNAVTVPLSDDHKSAICARATKFRPFKWVVMGMRSNLSSVTNQMNLAVNAMGDKQKETVVEIHGYLGYTFTSGKATKKALERQVLTIDGINAQLGYVLEFLNEVRSVGLCA